MKAEFGPKRPYDHIGIGRALEAVRQRRRAEDTSRFLVRQFLLETALVSDRYTLPIYARSGKR